MILLNNYFSCSYLLSLQAQHALYKALVAWVYKTMLT